MAVAGRWLAAGGDYSVLCRTQYECAPLGMERDLDSKPVTLFRRTVDALHPGATGSQAAALLEHRISRNVACNWLAGRRQAPQWALQLLARQIQARADELTAIADDARKEKERLGLSAGALNLRKYHATRSR